MDQLMIILKLKTPLDEVALRLLMASILGAILGWERERQHKPAGLRTYMMVCIGAASFLLLGLEISMRSEGVQDPIRIVSGIIGGIGFLGAGTIIQARGAVHGITTAAGIWVVGGVGAACGGGYYGLAVMTTLFAFCILTILHYFTYRYKEKAPEKAEH